jgi:hypothetical protein
MIRRRDKRLAAGSARYPSRISMILYARFIVGKKITNGTALTILSSEFPSHGEHPSSTRAH